MENTHWKTFALTPSGRPQFLPNEVEYLSQASINFYCNDVKVEAWRNQRIGVTSHRILVFPPIQMALALADVQRIEKEAGFLTRSSKITLIMSSTAEIETNTKTKTKTDLATTAATSDTKSVPNVDDVPKYYKLSFKQGGRDEIYDRLLINLNKRSWQYENKKDNTRRGQKDKDQDVQVGTQNQNQSQHQNQSQQLVGLPTKAWEEQTLRWEAPREFHPSNAGISGILKNRNMEFEETSRVAAEALKDLKALMENAKDVVMLLERYVLQETKRPRNVASNSSSTSLSNSFAHVGTTDVVEEKKVEDVHKGKGNHEDKYEGKHEDKVEVEVEGMRSMNVVQAMLRDIGLNNPVTKASVGADVYHLELARQLADFVRIGLDEAGMLSLSDVYCLFNRARGTALVSPDDLFTASTLLGQTPLLNHVGMRLRRLSSSSSSSSTSSSSSSTSSGGLLVLQSDLHSDEKICERIACLMHSKHTCLSITQFAAFMKISIPLATEYMHVWIRIRL